MVVVVVVVVVAEVAVVAVAAPVILLLFLLVSVHQHLALLASHHRVAENCQNSNTPKDLWLSRSSCHHDLLCQPQWFFQLRLSATKVLLLVIDHFSAFSTATDGVR